MSEFIKQYTKRPITIEAVKYNSQTYKFLLEWVPNSRIGTVTGNCSAEYPEGFEYPTFEIPTLEGVMSADLGDYIIKGIAGEFYPCKPKIFRNSYILGTGEE